MNRQFPIAIILLFLFTSLFSCIGTAPMKEVSYIDSLNRHAYSFRYKNLDSLYNTALQAYTEASLYSTGKAEACNNLGFYAFMKMDFDEAENLFREVYSLTQNELELLIADIGMMKIYQRTAMNKEFYDYRNTALRRIRRIDEDRNLFIDLHERKRLNFAYTEFSIVSAIYYYYLQQIPEAVLSLNEIKPEIELVGDTGQLLYYHYIRGSASLTNEAAHDRRRLNEFDELFLTWRLATAGGYQYFEANGLQGLSNLMVSPDNLAFIINRRSYALNLFGLPIDSVLPLQLARKALELFKEYDDIYQIAGAYVSIGRYLNEHGCYEEALDTLTKALDCVNFHHQLYYTNKENNYDVLYPYVENDTAYTEVEWITSEGSNQVKTVPEWISRIREQLSVSYAGLGMKKQSDYNRNVYLEILRLTRQDKELESRYSVLEEESRQLNGLLLFILFSLLILMFLFWIFSKRSNKRNKIYLSRLQLTLDICRKVVSSIPSEITDEKDIIASIKNSILPDLKTLINAETIEIFLNDEGNATENPKQSGNNVTSFDLNIDDKELPIGVLEITSDRKLVKDDITLIHIITPYIAWAIDNGMTFISLGDEREKLEKQRYIHEQHIAKSKRENLIKKACLAIINGIVPYIDRIINEVYKLQEKGFINNEKIKNDKYKYIDELVTTINEYNDILALWIKMKQGSISLNIENFSLDELFELVAKGRKTFEMKSQTFEVQPTGAVVKADKALTLFMINTLTENARKYTPAGGAVKLYARSTDEYVEISVQDNGIGLSPEDVSLINEEKVYDSRFIGMNSETGSEQLKRLKGNGFGLMNCKGIIEKYRKTNKVFNVCLFSAESELNKGSRFFFRLPLGVKKTLGVLLLFLLPLSFTACDTQQVNNKPVQTEADSLLMVHRQEYIQLLEEADSFVDTAYYCNVMQEFDLALQYINSAVVCLNEHYKLYSPNPHAYMSLDGDDTAAELIWWNEMFDTDYAVITDLRNEAAVSYLALKDWNAYSYNNKAYTAIYKLRSKDQNLEAYCIELERSTTNKIVGVILCIILLVSSLIAYYLIYVRKRINRWNLEQVLEINKKIFSSSLVRTEESVEVLQREENALKEIPQKIVDEAFESINDLLVINMLGLAVYNENRQQLEFASHPVQEEMPEMIWQSFEQQEYLSTNNTQAVPLIVDTAGTHQCVGVLYIERREDMERETDQLLLELISRYVTIVIFNAVVQLAVKYRDIESAYEDTYRASREDSMLHVQNMVLDNCLSTIKHETIYYPNKIKQIISKLSNGLLMSDEEKENVEAISELIEYYKGIFTVLSTNASRQLEEVTFRRSRIPVKTLTDYAEKYFRKASKANKSDVTLKISSFSDKFTVVGDKNQLNFLFENLIDEALSVNLSGELRIDVVRDEEFIRFLFTDTRREKTVEELNQLFYPNLERMASGEKGELRGTEYLVCKQIIREHDEYAGRRGCRINAEPSDGKGFTVYFTIPEIKEG